MAKRSSSFELALGDRNSEISACLWLYEAIRTKVLMGSLRTGTRLPATRDLARQYGFSRGTVINAFERLKSEGYIESSVGSGTYVRGVLPETLLHVTLRKTARPAPVRDRAIAMSDYAKRAKLFPGYENRPVRAFRSNLPALDLFPAELWSQVTARCLRRASTNLLMGCEPLGYRPLRDAIAEYLNSSRGLKCAAEQLAIVSGVQEALDLTARLILNPGDRVYMEDPGYTGATAVFEACGARLLGAGVDEEGLRVSRLLRQDVKLIYVTPGHQFPLAATMSLDRRLQLLEWARISGALIFEDDYDSEYRYSGRPIPALQGLDRRGSVIYAGTFSKVLFPALRIGYMVIPSDLLHHFEAAKSITDRHAPLLEQIVLRQFLVEGHFGRHVRRMREIYANRLAILQDEAERKLKDMVEIAGVKAGLQTTGWLFPGIDAERVASAAAQRNVEVIPLSRYGRGALRREGFQLGFAALDGREISRGVDNLAIALASVSRRTI
jgi:GntR family transcriptional regulator / MocR family aminotransferase